MLLIFPMVFALICMGGCQEQPVVSGHVIARFEGTDIMVDEVDFYLIINQVNYEMEYASAYPEENIWQMDLLGTGNTLEDDVKSSILQELRQMHILLKKADELGIVLEKEDEEELLILEEVFRDRYSEDVLNAIQVEDGVLQRELRQSMLAAKVKEVICNQNGWTGEDREEKFSALFEEWAKDFSFTIREMDWAEIHFEQGKYSIKEEEKEDRHEEIN